MILTRRQALEAGGAFLAASTFGWKPALALDVAEIAMAGKADGSRVWFDPVGLHVAPGETVRWTNKDPGNSHTTTAYHPDVFARPRRIPATAKPWNSDLLLPDQSFSVTFTETGVYDFYCIPHEHAGMVGRIVVGSPPAGEPAEIAPQAGLEPLPEMALRGFPLVADILAKGLVRRS